MDRPNLTSKQQFFVQEYLVDKNAARAARAAGYSIRSAASIGAENLRKPDIAGAIERALGEQMEKIEVTAEKIISRIAEFAFHKDSLRPTDILKACELLGKHYGLFDGKGQSPVPAPTVISVDGKTLKEAIAELEAEY